MCLSVPLLIIPSAPIITGTVLLLRCHIFSISISRCLILLILFVFIYNCELLRSALADVLSLESK